MADEAVIYVRISRDKAGAGLGVGRQENDCRDLAARLGLTVREVYADNDISAASGKRRPAYRRMLADLAAAPATVLCWHTDRLHRRPAELEEYVTLADARGITTHAVKAGHLDLATPSGKLVARMLGAAAAYETEHGRERKLAAKRQAAAKGEWRGGRRPFGYEADGYTLRPAEAEPLARGIRAVASGIPSAAVARKWNAAGLTTSTGVPWKPRNVTRVLLRARNAGLVENVDPSSGHGTVIGAALWEPVIAEAEWRAARAVLADPARVTGPGPARRWLLSGFAECGTCGTKLITNASHGCPIYLCRAPGRGHVARNSRSLDEYVTGAVAGLLRREDAAGRLNAPPPDTRLLQAEIDAVRAQLDGLAAEAGRRLISARSLAIASGPLGEELARLESRAAATRRPGTLSVFAGADPADVLGRMDVSERRTVVMAVFARVVVNPAPKGRPPGWRPGMPYFHAESIRLVPREDG